MCYYLPQTSLRKTCMLSGVDITVALRLDVIYSYQVRTQIKYQTNICILRYDNFPMRQF